MSIESQVSDKLAPASKHRTQLAGQHVGGGGVSPVSRPGRGRDVSLQGQTGSAKLFTLKGGFGILHIHRIAQSGCRHMPAPEWQMVVPLFVGILSFFFF